jgi:hypothetical protein
MASKKQQKAKKNAQPVQPEKGALRDEDLENVAGGTCTLGALGGTNSVPDQIGQVQDPPPLTLETVPKPLLRPPSSPPPTSGY